jgi:hypothetical protein
MFNDFMQAVADNIMPGKVLLPMNEPKCPNCGSTKHYRDLGMCDKPEVGGGT